MSEANPEARRRSFAIFGNEKVVEVVLIIATGSMPTTAQAVAIRAGIPHNLARAVLLKLASANFIVPLPRLGPRSAAYFDLASDQPAWDRLVALCRSVSEAPTAQPSIDPPSTVDR